VTNRAKGVAGLALAVAGLVALTSEARAETSPIEAAECVVDNDAHHVVALLRTVPGSPVEAKAAARLVQLYGACMDNRTVKGSFSWLERAELATAALNKRLTKDVTLPAASPAVWEADVKPTMLPGRDFSGHSLGLAMFGACVVRAAPDASLQYFRAEPTDAAAALATLRPTLASCMQPSHSLRLTPAQLRLIVAEPLYHALVR